MNDFLRQIPLAAQSVWNDPERRAQIESQPAGPLLSRPLSAEYLSRAALGMAAEAVTLTHLHDFTLEFLNHRYIEGRALYDQREAEGCRLIFEEAYAHVRAHSHVFHISTRSGSSPSR